MYRSLALICIFVLALSAVKAFPNGAPSSACPTNAMTLNMAGAGRHHPIVAGTGGYSLTAADASWTAGTPVALQLRGNAAWTGILIVGYKSGTTTQVGTWVLSQGYKLVSGRPAAVTQSSGGRKGPNIAFSWMPPAAGTGSVDFRALVVPSDRAAYLLDVALRLTERAGAPTPPVTAAPTTPAARPTTTAPTAKPTIKPTAMPTTVAPTTAQPVTDAPAPTDTPTADPTTSAPIADPTPSPSPANPRICSAADPLFTCTPNCALFQCEPTWNVRIRIPCPRGYSCNGGMCMRGRNQCKSATASDDD